MNAVDTEAFEKLMNSSSTPLTNLERVQLRQMRVQQTTATVVLHHKFGFCANPQLIPYRLPDGLNCFLKLNLAANQFAHNQAMMVPF